MFDVYILYLSPFLMFVYANAGDTGVEENFFFYILHTYIYIHIYTHVVWVGWGGAITFHCTYKLVALDIRQNQHRGCKDQSIEWRLVELDLPSGKRLHNYGKSPFLMGKSTINSHF